MKIYFAGSIRGDDSKKQIFEKIIRFLQQKGHTVLTEHVAEKDVEEKERQFTDEYIYERDIKWLEESDVVVAEATKPSYGVGFEVCYALNQNKPVYLLYDKNEEKVSAMACGCDLPGLTKFAYNDEKEIYEFLSQI